MGYSLVSVVISFLNPGQWLKEAVDSVIGQSYTYWEILLVDDGSVESDSNIAREYARAYPGKIRYIDHPGHRNIGLTASRNVGIKLASGSLIAFLDADDYWCCEKLSFQVDLFKKYPQIEMICEASLFWYSWEDALINDPITYIGVPSGIYAPGTLIKKLYPLGKGQPPCPSGIILKKCALVRNRGFEEAFSGIYQLYEDQAFLAKMYMNEVIYISDIAHNKYRKHEGSMTSASNDLELYTKVRNFYLDWLTHYLSERSIKDEAVNTLIISARLSVIV